MAEKVTEMVLKVDLQCPCCYKKVKTILCKFPQIRDQNYNEKANTVTITVVCCNPEKIRDKLCCKGAKVIKSIEIKGPPQPKGPEKPPKPEPKPLSPKDPKSPTQRHQNNRGPAPTPPLPCPVPAFPVRTCCGPCYEGYGGGPCHHGYGVRPPRPCYCGCSCGCGHVSRCDYYFSEENPQFCSIM